MSETATAAVETQSVVSDQTQHHPSDDKPWLWKPGTSANPGGRPKGIKTYSIRQLFAEVITDAAVRAQTVEKLGQVLGSRKRVLQALELGGRLSKELGLGSDAPGGVVVVINTNVPAGALGVAVNSGLAASDPAPRALAEAPATTTGSDSAPRNRRRARKSAK